jgi:polar amino acid transport system ATP-binding protein
MNLHLDGIDKSFGTQRVLEAISARFDAVRSLVLIGPSGGGKSTLLRFIAGLEKPESGTITLNGERLPADEPGRLRYRRTLGVVFQAFNLFPHLTALENLTLPLEKVHGQSAGAARERALSTLARFGLADHAQKRPAELSGGQNQRVAIARAIAIQPKLLLLDEPTSALDPEMTAEVLDVIGELKQTGTDFILVTHQMGFARRVADRVALLAHGRLLESGPPEELFENPQTAACRDFLSRVLKY